MNLSEYIEGVRRTECDYVCTKAFFAPTEHSHFRLLHAVMGISGETGELAEALLESDNMPEEALRHNGLEELGDLCWFCADAFDVLGVTDVPLVPVDASLASMRIWQLQGQAVDVLKRACFYGKELDTGKLIRILCEIWSNISALAIYLGSSIGQVCRLNNQKLRQRFPNKFTQEDALNRNIALERQVFKQV